MKKHQSIFWVKVNGVKIPATKNLVLGKKLHKEKLILNDKFELRSWDPYRSSLSAAIMNGLEILPLTHGFNVLYIGKDDEITISHLSDIIEQNGKLVCFMKNNISKIKNMDYRKNILLVNELEMINQMVSHLFDIVYIDLYNEYRLTTSLELYGKFLKEGGFLIMLLPSQPRQTFKESIKIIRENFQLVQKINLANYYKDYTLVIAQKS